MRLGKSFSVRDDQSLQITANIFDFPNLISRRWGLVRETSPTEGMQGLLTVTGWDAVAKRPIYSIAKVAGKPVMPSRNRVVVDASRWRMEIGARYSF